jgi:uncharacterized membrane protein YedE/YeeE
MTMFELLEQLRETYETGPLVVMGALVIGLLFGAITEISRYCMRAAVAEHVEDQTQDKSRPRTLQVLFAILIALAGTQLLHAFGLIDLSSAIHWSVSIKPLALIIGGGLFGLGMVLAGGCVSRLLVLAASGNIRSWVTLLITALTGYATLRGLLSYPRIWLESAWDTETTGSDILASAGTLELVTAVIALTVGALAVVLLRQNRPATPWFAITSGALVGLLVVAAWFVTGVVGEDEFEPTQLSALSFVAPVGETVQYFMIFTGDTIRFSIALVLGVLAGAAASAMIAGRFKFTGFTDEKSILRYIAGGALMGFGGVTALGCSVGQGLSGVSTASPASVLALISIVFSAYATMKLQRFFSADTMAQVVAAE